MSSEATFDFYAELEVGQLASVQDVTASYRRLVRIHHPDRNPDDLEEATARFQRLQLSYETLSNPARRARYDAHRQTSPFPFVGLNDDNDNDSGLYAFWRRISAVYQGPFVHIPGYGHINYDLRDNPMMLEATIVAGLMAFSPRSENEIYAARQADWAAMAKTKEMKDAEREAQKMAKKKEAEDLKQAEKNRLLGEEQQKQLQRFKELNAVTKDEKLAACLHSDFCQKIQQKKKFKCSACSVKRGMIAFECPHCSAFLCQLCVTDSSNERKKLDKPAGRKATGTTGVHGKPATGTQAIFKKPYWQQKTQKEKKNSKWAPTPYHKTTNGTPAASNTVNSGKVNKAKTKPKKPKAGPTLVKVTPGATRGFIHIHNPKHTASQAQLRQAMGQFGAVASLRVTNKNHGQGQVEFADHDSLRRAIAASPVAVTDRLAVRIVELKKCGGCGISGHVTEECQVQGA